MSELIINGDVIDTSIIAIVVAIIIIASTRVTKVIENSPFLFAFLAIIIFGWITWIALWIALSISLDFTKDNKKVKPKPTLKVKNETSN